jgi:hypothetical protein
MADHFARPAKLFEAGISGLRNADGVLAAGYYVRWTQTWDTSPEAATAIGLCSDPEGLFLYPNPVRLGPRGEIQAYGLGKFKLELFADLTALGNDDINFTFYVQLGVVAP